MGDVMPVRDSIKRPLVGVIDDGTRTVRFVVYEAQKTDELCAHQLDKVQSAPREGWSEQDPMEILKDIDSCVSTVLQQLQDKGYTKEDIVTLGVTNQRETTIVWDKFTGEPLHPAIVWNDIRTDSTVDAILAKIPDRNKNYLKGVSGLPISPYFSALKMKWLKDNVRAVRRACREKRALFGTVDSWIVWNLTGGVNGGLHITDVTNASRTLLMNIETLSWDPMLCRLFGIHPELLPEIRSSSEEFGVVRNGSALDGIRISGILGNQQSALVGQVCVEAGQAKNTYRSGCFLLYNTGGTRVSSSHGLVTTLAYQLGADTPPVYALEGSVAVAGGAMKFLRDKLGLMRDVCAEAERAASQLYSTGDVYFVPAFSGLYAPYWRKDARGIICGLTAFTTKNHIIRAALEAVCFQTRDILEAMHKDCGVPLNKLHVDGNMTANNLLMQLQADLIGMPVLRSHSWDMTALGVGMVAGRAVGVWPEDSWQQRDHHASADVFLPTIHDDERDARYTKWKMAVQRSLGWATTKKSITISGQHQIKLKSRSQSLNLSRESLERTLSLLKDSNSDEGRLNEDDSRVIGHVESDGFNPLVKELIKYSQLPLDSVDQTKPVERTILDDLEHFERKNESDFGLYQCCQVEKPISNWEKIGDIIENDPEIIFDSQNNPVCVNTEMSSLKPDCSENICALGKRRHLEKLPFLFRLLYGRPPQTFKVKT